MIEDLFEQLQPLDDLIEAYQLRKAHFGKLLHQALGKTEFTSKAIMQARIATYDIVIKDLQKLYDKLTEGLDVDN